MLHKVIQRNSLINDIFCNDGKKLVIDISRQNIFYKITCRVNKLHKTTLCDYDIIMIINDDC